MIYLFTLGSDNYFYTKPFILRINAVTGDAYKWNYQNNSDNIVESYLSTQPTMDFEIIDFITLFPCCDLSLSINSFSECIDLRIEQLIFDKL